VNRKLENLVEARGRLPLERQLHQLVVESAADQRVAKAERSKKLRAADVNVIGPAGIEHDSLRIALSVAHAYVIAERFGHRIRICGNSGSARSWPRLAANHRKRPRSRTWRNRKCCRSSSWARCAARAMATAWPRRRCSPTARRSSLW